LESIAIEKLLRQSKFVENLWNRGWNAPFYRSSDATYHLIIADNEVHINQVQRADKHSLGTNVQHSLVGLSCRGGVNDNLVVLFISVSLVIHHQGVTPIG